MTEAKITALEHSHPDVRAIDSNDPDIHYLVDEDQAGIILVFDNTKVGLTRDEARLFCRELADVLYQHLGVSV